MNIREFRINDYEYVMELWRAAGLFLSRSDDREEIQKKLERDADLFIVAEENGRIIGAVMGCYDGRRDWVNHLAVAPDYQGKSLGMHTHIPPEPHIIFNIRQKKGDSCIGIVETEEGWKTLGLGPFTLQARQEILRRLLQTQAEVRKHDPDMKLITPEELIEIRRWIDEGDFAVSLPRIVEEVTGEKMEFVVDEIPMFKSEQAAIWKRSVKSTG